MNTLLALARAAHYAGAMVVLGELVFLSIVRPAGVRQDSVEGAGSGNRRDAGSGRIRIIGLSLAIAVAADCMWLGAEAGVMSGLPWQQAIGWDTLSAVLGQTMFGRIWVWRLLLTGMLCVVLLMLRMDTRGRYGKLPLQGALLLAAAVLATTAFAGHPGAGAGTGSEWEDRILLASDVLHLLAAGAWIGALPALISMLDSTRSTAVASSVTQRFSRLALVCVAALAATGLVNAWFLVGTVAGLLGTLYGQLLSAKLALFCIILGFATVNRWIVTPALNERSVGAQQWIRRNGTCEFALGLGIVVIVGVLGMTIPATHQSALWPFAHRLSWERAGQSPLILTGVLTACALLLASIAAALLGIRRRRRVSGIAGVAAAIVAVGFIAVLLAVPAFPTSYLASPIAYDVDNVSAGAKAFAGHCTGCHGGDRDGAGTRTGPERLSVMSSDPSVALPGDLFWRIAHGVAGASGHAFSPALSDRQLWQVVNFLDAKGASALAARMTGQVQPQLRAPAPDFTFEVAGSGQSSLLARRELEQTLLVFYTLPQSLPRLRELIGLNHALMHLGMQVIAIPTRPDSPLPAGVIDATAAAAGATYVLVARASAEVPTVYAMFAHNVEDVAVPPMVHAELLLDRNGDLRARWLGVPVPADRWDLDIEVQTMVLARESARPRPLPHRGH